LTDFLSNARASSTSALAAREQRIACHAAGT
jgi:hypothetical protein